MRGKQHPITQCGKCEVLACYSDVLGLRTKKKILASCPMRNYAHLLKSVKEEYHTPQLREFAHQATYQTYSGYQKVPGGWRCLKSRLEEIIDLAKIMGYKRLGLAFCSGVLNESRILTSILENKGFEVASVCCKMGAIPVDWIGIKEEEKLGGPGAYEVICNPVFQAKVLNASDVDLNILFGLCVGHDTIFIKYAKAPITVLACKDRVFGHNPMAAIYLASSVYYKRLLSHEPPIVEKVEV